MKTFLRFCLAAILLTAGAVWAVERPAMVADLQGKAVVEGGENVGILSPLSSGVTLALNPQAKLVMVYLKSGDQYELTGPGRYQVGAAAPQALSGAQPVRRKTALAGYGTGRINPVGKVQAGLLMREAEIKSLKLLSPSGSHVATERPVFRWEPVPGAAAYHVELDNDAGATVAEGNVGETRFTLPDGVALAEKTHYSWSVDTTVNGQHYVKWGQFSLLGKSERERVEKLKPAPDAPFAERVLYAAMLEEMGLRDDARPWWQALAAERPNDERLRALAEE